MVGVGEDPIFDVHEKTKDTRTSQVIARAVQDRREARDPSFFAEGRQGMMHAKFWDHIMRHTKYNFESRARRARPWVGQH